MEIKTFGKFCILTPMTPFLDRRQCLRVLSELNTLHDFELGLDLSFVEDCTIDFFELLKNFNNISLFNISSSIYALINAMNFDKNVCLYVSEDDFIEKQRRLLNRKFNIV